MAEATAFEQVTRERVVTVSEDLGDYKNRMNGSLEKIDQRLIQIERALNSRPNWVTLVLITFLTSLSTGLTIYALMIR
ncbi:MAG: hypothetical protein ACLKAK_07370 [Alkaliphilus sp.]